MTDTQLIALFLASYTLTEQDITTLAQNIATHRLNVMQASYRRSQRYVHLPQNWTPPNNVTKRIEQQSMKDAKGIAATYKQYLASFLETVLKIEKGWRDLFGSVKEAISQMISNVGEWLKDFLGWKPDQIANASIGAGLSDGTMQFVEDVLSAESGDGTLVDEDGNTVIDTSMMDVEISAIGIQILPEDASNDVCRTIAGRTFTIDEYQDIYDLVGELPVHPFCKHYASIVQLS